MTASHHAVSQIAALRQSRQWVLQRGAATWVPKPSAFSEVMLVDYKSTESSAAQVFTDMRQIDAPPFFCILSLLNPIDLLIGAVTIQRIAK